MALTYTDYIFAGGDAPTYPVTFPYLDPSDIYVLVNGISTDEFVFNADSDTVTLNTAPPVGTVVRVYRSTPGLTEDQPTMLVDFQDGSVLSESDLDKANDQLLYCLQETNDGAQSGLIIDYDGNYNAGGKRIKQVGAPTSDNDATTKAYVDGIALYGDGFAAQSAPQQWVFSGSDFTGTTGNVSVVLLDPEPLATSVYMYVVDLDGVMQNPGIDFYVSGHTFVLVMDENALDPDATIVIRNFGIARSILQTPITSDAPDVVALSVKSLEIQNANLQEWTDSDGTAVACIAPTGDAEVKNLDVDGDITLSGSIVSPDGTPLGGSLEALSDTEIDGASDGEVLTYDAASDKWIAELPAAGDATLDDITDVNVPAPTDGQVLTWNTESGQWVAATPTGGGGGGGGDVSVIAAVSPGIYEGVDNTITLSGNFSLSINDKITFAYGEVKTEVEPIAATSTKVLVAVPPEIYALPTDSVVSVSVNDVVPLSVIILPTPTGGDYQTAVGGYFYSIFKTNGTLVSTSTYSDVDYLLVAGGGGSGASYRCGGGGAGGVLSTGDLVGGSTQPNSPISLPSGSFPIFVGSGGSGTSGAGGAGGNTTFMGLTAVGGSGGTQYQGNAPAQGGSGGGCGSGWSTEYNGGSGTPGQGNNGGGSSSTLQQGGGGGGAGHPGGDAKSTNGDAGFGGDGVPTNLLPVTVAESASVGEVIGSNVWVGGGGAGSGYAPGGNPQLSLKDEDDRFYGQGKGGGGASYFNPSGASPTGLGTVGMPNTGGGGGANVSGDGNDGGSGFALIRINLNGTFDSDPGEGGGDGGGSGYLRGFLDDSIEIIEGANPVTIPSNTWIFTNRTVTSDDHQAGDVIHFSGTVTHYLPSGGDRYISGAVFKVDSVPEVGDVIDDSSSTNLSPTTTDRMPNCNINFGSFNNQTIGVPIEGTYTVQASDVGNTLIFASGISATVAGKITNYTPQTLNGTRVSS